MRIALIPLDERPVNVQLPRQVAAIAGHDVITPPSQSLPRFRDAGDTEALGAWLEDVAADCDALVVCIDTLAFGGLIAARTSGDTLLEAMTRLHVLRRVAQRLPHLGVHAVSLVMRASDSYSDTEEPEYWSSHGRELHRLGGDLHRHLSRLSDLGDAGQGDQVPSPTVPDSVREDFERRRLRNHAINLAALDLAARGDIDFLALTADDTAPQSAGSAEQAWLGHWLRAIPLTTDRAMMYPGADEVGAQLVARAICSAVPAPRWRVECPEPGGLDRVPNYENVPLSTSIARQIQVSGGITIAADRPSDLTLIVNAADPARGDRFGGQATSDPHSVELVVTAVRAALARGELVALADLRFSNGADPLLMDRLAEEDVLLRLVGYGGWNTAGNALGGVVASAAAYWAGSQTGTLDADAAREALMTRLLDDWIYQSRVRAPIQHEIFGGSITRAPAAVLQRATAAVEPQLRSALTEMTDSAVSLRTLSFPWERSFEVHIELDTDHPMTRPESAGSPLRSPHRDES